MGEAYISFSSLFGDEDAVVGSHSLSVRKWVRVHSTRALADEGIHVGLGHLLVFVSLAFEQPLLPPGWQEAVDSATGGWRGALWGLASSCLCDTRPCTLHVAFGTSAAGREYYFSSRLGTSQWEEPSELRSHRVVAIADRPHEDSGPASAKEDSPMSSTSPPHALQPQAPAASPDAGATPSTSLPPPTPASGDAPHAETHAESAIVSPQIVRAAARKRIAADEEDGAEDRGPAEATEAEGAEVEDVDDFVAESVPLQSSSASAAAVSAVPEFVNPLEKEARKSLAGGERMVVYDGLHATLLSNRAMQETEIMRSSRTCARPLKRASMLRRRSSE